MAAEKKKYVGKIGGPGGFDGYAGLRIGESYTGTVEGDTVRIILPNGRPTSVSLAQWKEWFS
jgi:hypothetical protein